MGDHDRREVTVYAVGVGTYRVARTRIGPSGWEVTVTTPTGRTIRGGLHRTVAAAVAAMADQAARIVGAIG